MSFPLDYRREAIAARKLHRIPVKGYSRPIISKCNEDGESTMDKRKGQKSDSPLSRRNLLAASAGTAAVGAAGIIAAQVLAQNGDGQRSGEERLNEGEL